MSEPLAETAHIADDLFAGAGGWDLGASALGIHARGVEIMQEACATREAAGLPTIHDDVWTFTPDGKAAGLIASPPCQTFSTAGKGAGRKALDDVLAGIRGGFCRDIDALRFFGMTVGDDRTGLVLTPLHFALTGGYQWLAWEQVPAVLPVWEACADVLRAEGWNVWTGYLHAEQYGVPQTRKRAVLLASRTARVAQPVPTHSRYYSRTPEKLDAGVARWVSMAEALGWGWSQQPAHSVTSGGGDGRSVWADKGVRAQMEDAAGAGCHHWVLQTGVNSATVGPGAKRDGLMAEGRWRECHKPQERVMDAPAPTVTSQTSGWSLAPSGSSCTVVDPRPASQPAPTITGKGNAEWTERGRRANPGEMRDPNAIRLVPAEAGVLQTFPADYPWQGTQGKKFLQAGNAIPPRMAMHALAVASGVVIESEEAVA